MNHDLTPEYICTHYGEEELDDKYHNAVIPPIAATSLHVFKDVESYLDYFSSGGVKSKDQYSYGRVSNPTVALLEKKLAALERADGALCFGSGMAAITSAIMHCVKPGGHIISINNVYGVTKNFFDNKLKKWGVETDYVRGCDPSDFKRMIRPETTLFYLESPSGLSMDLQDLKTVAAIAKTHGIKTIVDNSCATSIYQQPITLGIDIVVHTMSKYIGGHSDIIGGVICSDADTIFDINREGRQIDGGILSPFEAWLCIRGLRTLPVRVKKSGENAMAMAKLLDESPKIHKVNYPGLSSHPQFELANRQMSGFSGLLSFEPHATKEQCIKFGNSLRLFQTGVSWGGFESLFGMTVYTKDDEQDPRHGEECNLIRLYCGLEDTHSLLDDVTHALDIAF
jgi:cystathionine gamma-lyase